MEAIVIGGGVVGAATAYFLGRAGVKVTVLERGPAAGLETSFGLAGLISPSDANAWASPSALKMAITSMFKPDSGIKYKFKLDPTLWRWSLEFLAQCRPSAVAKNTTHKYRLADFSMEMLRDVEAATSIDYEGINNGILFTCKDGETLEGSTEFCGPLASLGLDIGPVDLDECVEKVPALADRTRNLAGGMYSKNCRTGNAGLFARNLLAWCVENQNCKVEYDTEVQLLARDGDRISNVHTSKGEMIADTYVLTAGPYSGLLSKQIGLRLPICPVKGFSITADIVDFDRAPTCGLADENSPVAVSRMGNKLRIASSAVFDGFNPAHSDADFKQILSFADEMLPGVADYASAKRWSGFRPMTPSSVPLIGRSRQRNLFVNTGHGHLGWTMACGSGKLISDIVTGVSPQIDAKPYQPSL